MVIIIKLTGLYPVVAVCDWMKVDTQQPMVVEFKLGVQHSRSRWVLIDQSQNRNRPTASVSVRNILLDCDWTIQLEYYQSSLYQLE